MHNNVPEPHSERLVLRRIMSKDAHAPCRTRFGALAHAMTSRADEVGQSYALERPHSILLNASSPSSLFARAGGRGRFFRRLIFKAQVLFPTPPFDELI
jgi:hypothetical protein